MGWEKNGRYYTRSRKVDGRVVREYIGGGDRGAIAARMDALQQKTRDWERDRWRLEKEDMKIVDSSVDRLCEIADIIAKAAMVAAGYHCYRGEWRRRRGQKKKEAN